MTIIYDIDQADQTPLNLKGREAPIDPMRKTARIPVRATDKKPPQCEANQAARWSGDEWEIVPDYRGHVYYFEDGTKHTITELGEKLPEGALLEAPPPPEPTFDELLATALAQRSAAYKTESDPLYIEWQYDQTDEGEAKWRTKVQQIKQRYPLPTE